MSNIYAIIDDENGWMVNLVVWDGSTETWTPPIGTHAVNIDQIDVRDLPANLTRDQQ